MDAEWERELNEIPLRKTDRSSWPRGIRPISVDEMGSLGIDVDGLIYWNGMPIQVRRKIELRAWELSIAIIATAATVIQAAVALMPSLPKLFETMIGIAK